MLGIKGNDDRWYQWHVNEPLPEVHGPVITFEADGHELDLILIALRMTYGYDGTLTKEVE